MDSRDLWDGQTWWTRLMDSLDGLWLLIVNCMQERSEDPPSLGQFITPATFHPFKCQRSSYCCIELIDYLTKCIWEPTKTSRMRRSYASGRRASLSEGQWGTNPLKKQKSSLKSIGRQEPVSGLVGQIQLCLLQAEWHPRGLSHHLGYKGI